MNKAERIFSDLEERKEAIGEILSWTTYDKFIAFVKLYLDREGYKIFQKDVRLDTVVHSIITAAQASVYVNGVHSHLVTRETKTKGKFICTLMIDYKGMRQVVKRNLPVKDIYAHVVREGDYFEPQLGDNPKMPHKPKTDRDSKGELKFAYAVAVFKDGYKAMDFMNEFEIAEVKGKAKYHSIWNEFEAQMWKKSVLRRLCGTLMEDEPERMLPIQRMLDVENENFDLGIKKSEEPDIDFTKPGEETPDKAKKPNQCNRCGMVKPLNEKGNCEGCQKVYDNAEKIKKTVEKKLKEDVKIPGMPADEYAKKHDVPPLEDKPKTKERTKVSKSKPKVTIKQSTLDIMAKNNAHKQQILDIKGMWIKNNKECKEVLEQMGKKGLEDLSCYQTGEGTWSDEFASFIEMVYEETSEKEMTKKEFHELNEVAEDNEPKERGMF